MGASYFGGSQTRVSGTTFCPGLAAHSWSVSVQSACFDVPSVVKLESRGYDSSMNVAKAHRDCESGRRSSAEANGCPGGETYVPA